MTYVYVIDRDGDMFYSVGGDVNSTWYDSDGGSVDIKLLNEEYGPLTKLVFGERLEFFKPHPAGTKVRVPNDEIPGGYSSHGVFTVVDYDEVTEEYQVSFRIRREEVKEYE